MIVSALAVCLMPRAELANPTPHPGVLTLECTPPGRSGVLRVP